MKKTLFIVIMLLTGCLATENRKVAITQKNDQGVAVVDTSCWWRNSTAGVEDDKNPWLEYLPKTSVDEEAELLEYFEDHVVKWPKAMKKPVHDGVLRIKIRITQEELKKLLKKMKKRQSSLLHKRSEVY